MNLFSAFLLLKTPFFTMFLHIFQFIYLLTKICNTEKLLREYIKFNKLKKVDKYENYNSFN